MWDVIADGFAYLGAQSGPSLFLLFWVVVVFEFPRYLFQFAATLVTGLTRRVAPAASPGRVSLVIAGHSEGPVIETCVRALREQSRPPDEIIVVSDGSQDGMPARIRDLAQRGLIDRALWTELRCGKSAAVNLASRYVTGDILVNVDVDCTFDRDALKEVVAPFADPAVGAVSGNLMVRNPTQTLVTAFQAIEYLIAISLGKTANLITGQVVCVSGGFGAFRCTALAAVGGMDVGGGEDLDCTLRLRKVGWRISFAPNAIAYTHVPHTLTGFTRQRFRWERDAVRLRYRKHGEQVNPFSRRFILSEFLHEAEFFLFHVAAAVATPVYIVWLVVTYGDLALPILLAAQAGLALLDGLIFALAALAAPKAPSLRLAPYLLGYSLFNGLFMRFIRLAAYAQEWLFDASSGDCYVPRKVRLLRRW